MKLNKPCETAKCRKIMLVSGSILILGMVALLILKAAVIISTIVLIAALIFSAVQVKHLYRLNKEMQQSTLSNSKL